ncbi:phage tail protein [Dickeya sp. CFBP 2040]|uniref:phage tail-collar fiber domain-containing protein n=1 Tax=Dickeya sp. CFBP 2040 TaxID=2718531 RepID=UPI0014481B9B|nr:phage tail protein [Dickeya sp. CFBP 2040]NKI74761.1 phage tail protein [Dickeya sp. CFBP 2040]
MSTKYTALLTKVGAARLANAIAQGKQLEITRMGVGDGGGVLPTPDPSQTALLNEKRRAALNSLVLDPTNANQIIAEQVIPENEGGFWLREIGLYDANDNLIAVANCPETYKPQLQEGSGRVQTVRMILAVSQTDAVSLTIDPAVVLASRKYVDDKALSSQAYTDTKVTEVKSYTDNGLAAHIAAVSPHKQYAPIESPALTGVPTAPTVNSGNNSSQLATTAFVHNAIADNAFALDFTSRATGWDVPWDAKSGFYEAYLGSYSQAVLHFHGSASSCTALQFAARYGNGGLSYRTSRDDKGFEHDWEQIYTTGFRPSPADIGALSVAEFNQTITSYALLSSPSFTGNVAVTGDGTQIRLQQSTVAPASGSYLHSVDSAGAFLWAVGRSENNRSLELVGKGGNRVALTDGGDITIAPTVGGATRITGTVTLTAPAAGDNSNSAITSAWFAAELAGIPLPFPGAVAPTGWLKCNGQTFDKNRYPRLAQLYPSGTLPDLRGEFIRGWDDGRGVDAGRQLFSWQGDEIRSHSHDFVSWPNSGNSQSKGGAQDANGGDGRYYVHSGIVLPAGGMETRPRNIAFNYIVRAA